MTITYEGCDVYTLHIGSRVLELSHSEIEEIQRFGGDKSTFEYEEDFDDLKWEFGIREDTIKDLENKLEDKDEEISELQNKLYNLEQNLFNQNFTKEYITELQSKVLDKDWK